MIIMVFPLRKIGNRLIKRPKAFLLMLIRTMFLLLPSLLLVALLADIVASIYLLNNVNEKKIYEDLRTYLSKKEGRSFPLPDQLSSAENNKTNIFVFGESSVVITNKHTFAHYLQELLTEDNPNINVVNFGISGVDSFSIKKRVQEALTYEPAPQIAILYLGHNDFNNAYHNSIFPHHESFGLILRIAYPLHVGLNFFSGGTKHILAPEDQFISLHSFYDFDRFCRPPIMKLLQLARVVRVNSSNYSTYNKLILESFSQNMSEIIELLSSKGVITIPVTPVGNLRAEPFGEIGETTLDYKLGLQSSDYDESVTYLRKAKDAELFTFDIRAKSCLNNYLRNVRQRKVYVLDLEKMLMEKRFEFGYSHFLDYLHFNDRGHWQVAACLHEFMLKERAIREKIQQGLGSGRQRGLHLSASHPTVSKIPTLPDGND